MTVLTTRGSMESKKKEGSNVWSILLSDFSKLGAENLNFNNIVVVGNDLAGKSSLANKLSSTEESHRGSALDFQIIEIQDEDVDENEACRLWILDGNLAYRSLLQYAMPKETFSRTIGIVVVDMSEPWNIPDTLDKWLNVLAEHIDSLKINPTYLQEYKQRLLKNFQSYKDPSDEVLSPKVESKLHLNHDVDSVETLDPLDGITLQNNLGISLIVACTKCDHIESLESECDFKEEHYDYIQHYLRIFCLKYGAALVYTSMKESKNHEILKNYILHKLYGHAFDVSASVVDKDSVFVPSGWDSEKKINILSEGFSKFSANDSFNAVISRPPTVRINIQDHKELLADEEQQFLGKAQTILSKAPSVSKPGAIDTRSRLKQEGRIGLPTNLPGTTGKPGQADGSKTTPGNERMLANFFNSLLNKKTTTGKVAPKSPKPKPDAAASGS